MTGPIPQLVNVPSTSDPENFAAEADNLFGTQLPAVIEAMNDVSVALNDLSTTSTSVTSNTIGTGSKAFTVETGKSYFEGRSLTIARTSAPTNRMFAVVDSYDPDTGALVVTSQAFEGSGTFTDWTITLGFNGVIGTGQIAEEAITLSKLNDDVFTSAYKKSNIVGTVSQSGGTPTGAIIEVGSNANGRYIRFADGTQITCGLHVRGGTGTTSHTFPASFAAAPVCAGSVELGAAQSYFSMLLVPSVNSVGVRAYDHTGAQTPSNVVIIAIGTWY